MPGDARWAVISPGPYSLRETTSRDGFHRGREVVNLQGLALARVPYQREADGQLLAASWDLLHALEGMLADAPGAKEAAGHLLARLARKP